LRIDIYDSFMALVTVREVESTFKDRRPELLTILALTLSLL